MLWLQLLGNQRSRLKGAPLNKHHHTLWFLSYKEKLLMGALGERAKKFLLCTLLPNTILYVCTWMDECDECVIKQIFVFFLQPNFYD